MFKLEKRNGKMYLTFSSTMWSEPAILTSYWPTDAPLYDELDGLMVQEVGVRGYYVNAFGKQIPFSVLTEGSEFVEKIPVAKPGRGYIWHNGEWVKKTQTKIVRR